MIREAQIALPSRRGKGLRRLSLVMLMLAASISLASDGRDRQHGAGKNRVSPELARLSDAVQHGNIKNQTIQVIVQFKSLIQLKRAKCSSLRAISCVLSRIAFLG